MSTLIFLKGLPGSGKTTWALQKIKTSEGHVKRVNKDDLREMIDGGKWSKKNEQMVLTTRDNLVISYLDNGYDVIVDDTNLHPKHQARMEEIAQMKGASFQLVNFDTDVEECVKRDAKRTKSVGEKVIRDMYNRYFSAKEPEEKQDETLPRAIICDLDGTIALIGNRNPYDASTATRDFLNKPIASIVKRYQDTHYILFVSGRKSIYKGQTTMFLAMHDLITAKTMLFMRGADDNRKDAIVKKEIYDGRIKGKYYVEFVLDDRTQVVDMWREEGLTCLQVAKGDF